jgi:beta-hydroxylase
MHIFLSTQSIIIYVFIICGIYVHKRGKVRLSFLRQLTDHSTFFSPINTFVYLFSAVKKTAFLDSKDFPETQILEQNWQVILSEAEALLSDGSVKASGKFDDAGFNSFFKTGWKRFYLKWYGKCHPSAIQKCPKTIELLKKTPSIKAAMFAYLPAGAKLVRHRDPYAGSLRYHLGLSTPNSNKCQMIVDGETQYWKDGKSMMFDETFIHYAENKSSQGRLILLCDYERPVKFILPKYIVKLFNYILLRSATSPNERGDKTGMVNKIFSFVYYIRIWGKKIKARNKPIYYILKYLLIISLIYAALFSWS